MKGRQKNSFAQKNHLYNRPMLIRKHFTSPSWQHLFLVNKVASILDLITNFAKASTAN
jgi:hypothetical protein